jgi:hypothetical protein
MKLKLPPIGFYYNRSLAVSEEIRKEIMAKIELDMGVEARDRVTGLKGIITGKTIYINGCVQWLLKPPVDKDGKLVDGCWIDTIQLEVTGPGISIETPEVTPGGPRVDAPPTAYRS